MLPSPRIRHQFHLNCRYKIFAINLPSQPFLGRHLGFYIFSQWPSWGPHTFFTAGLFWIRFHFFSNCILQSWHIAINGCCYLFSLFFMQANICSALHVCHAYFLKKKLYVLYISMIKSEHEAAKCM